MGLPLFAPRRPPVDGAPTQLPPNTRLPTVVGQGAAAYPRGREVAALLLWTGAVFLALALASYSGDPGALPVDAANRAPPGANWVGSVGELSARGLVSLVGIVAWSVPFELVLLGIPFVRGKKSLITPARISGDLLIVLLATALVQVGWPEKTAFGHHTASGAVGELFGELARALFSTVGSFLVGFAALGLILIARASFSFIALVRAIGRLFTRGGRAIADAVRWRAVERRPLGDDTLLVLDRP